MVDGVGDAVAVVVEIGAAVAVLVAVEIFGVVGTAVDGVGDAVAVVVRIGTTVVVLERVAIFGLVGTAVEAVGDAVEVVVAVGVAGLGFGRAPEVARGLRSPAHAGEHAEPIVARGVGHDVEADAGRHRHLLRREELQPGDDVDGAILARVGRPDERLVAVDLGDDAEPTHHAVGDARRPRELVADLDEHARVGRAGELLIRIDDARGLADDGADVEREREVADGEVGHQRRAEGVAGVAEERGLVAERQRYDREPAQAEPAVAERARLEADAHVERAGVGRRDVGAAVAEEEAGAGDGGIAGGAVQAVRRREGLIGYRELQHRLEPAREAERDADVGGELPVDEVLAPRHAGRGIGQHHRQGAVGKIEHQLEPEAGRRRRLGALDGEEAVAVDGRLEQVRVDAALGARARRGAQDGHDEEELGERAVGHYCGWRKST